MELNGTAAELEEIKAKLKKLLVAQLSLEDLNPADIEDDAELFGEGLGLDSLDAVEIAVAVEKKYNVRISLEESSRVIFRTVKTLAGYVRKQMGPAPLSA